MGGEECSMEIWKLVVNRRSATVLDSSATVLSRPHYGV